MNNYLLEYKLQEKQGRKWVTVEHYTKQATEEQLNNCICKETLRWFRNLGGKEKVERAYNYIRNISTSPSGDLRSIRTFWYNVNKEIKLEV